MEPMTEYTARRIVAALEDAMEEFRPLGVRTTGWVTSTRGGELAINLRLEDMYDDMRDDVEIALVRVLVTNNDEDDAEIVLEAVESMCRRYIDAWQVRNRYDLEWL